MSSDEDYVPSDDASDSSDGSVFDGFTEVERTIVDDHKLKCLFRKINTSINEK